MNFKLFCLAARRGNEHMVPMMAAQDTVFINGSNRRGRTALHVAAEFGHIAVVRRLVRLGADVNKTDIFQMIALYVL